MNTAKSEKSGSYFIFLSHSLFILHFLIVKNMCNDNFASHNEMDDILDDMNNLSREVHSFFDRPLE